MFFKIIEHRSKSKDKRTYFKEQRLKIIDQRAKNKDERKRLQTLFSDHFFLLTTNFLLLTSYLLPLASNYQLPTNNY